MTSTATTSRKSSRLEIQTQKTPLASRKSDRLNSAPPQPPASTAPPTPAARKSEKLVTELTSSPEIRKSGRLLKLDAPSPVGITGRSKKRSSSPVGLKEGSISSETKKKREKKEKSIEMLQTETSQIPTDYEQHCMPLKRRLDGRSYKARYKTQRTRIGTADSDEELRRSATVHRIDQINNVDNGATSSQLLGDKKDLGEELCSPAAEDLSKDLPEVVCEGAFLESHSGLIESNAHLITKNVEDIASIGPKNGLTLNSSNEGIKEGLNMQASESVTPSTSSATEIPDFVANCFLCSKKRRLVFDSPEEELCPCTITPKRNLSDLSCQKSSKGSFVKLQKLLVGGSTTAGDSLLNNVNRLREFWHKKQNAVVVDEIERMVNMIAFIFSLSDVHKPLFVSGTLDTLAQWEAEFIRLKPSINVVVYHAASGTKNSIRSIEFHRDEGGKIFQVLLCSLDVISEDFQILKHLKCEILILDECQISMNFDVLKMLDADMRILLFSGSLKVDSASLKDKRDEYLSVLSFLYPPGELDKVDRLKYDENDSIVKLVESFSRFIAYDSSKFVEYWVPVPLSNLQLEQYCHTLHSGSSALISNNLKTGIVGEKVHDVLMTVRKCCDHPYLADQKLVASRMRQSYSPSENVDFGIKASGKLHLLCKLLSNMKSHKLRALVLYQSFDGSRESIGDMLEDLLRDRFGADQYERIDRLHVHQGKRHAAVNRFAKEDSKQFVFLLENRACNPWIKLSVDVVVLLSSEWTPALDLRTLERLTFNSKSGKVPIFRLYCSCTIEEKALILGKQLPVLNVKSGTTSSTLLMWGASSLFSRLENYHASSSNASDVDVSSEHALLDDVVKDLMAILFDTAICDSLVSKAFIRSGNGIYHTDRPLLGESKDQLNVGEEPLVFFWKKLLEGKSFEWKFSHEPLIRNRKRVLYSDESPKKSEILHDESGKKRKKTDGTSVIANSPVEPDAKERETVGSEKDAVKSSSQKKSFSRQNSVSLPNNRSPTDGQQSLHDFLKAKITILWKALKLSEDVVHMIHRILEHLIENHNVSKDDPHVLQAFQMSLCWIASDMLGKKIDRKGSLLEARKILNFECPEDLTEGVYIKLTSLKNTFPQPPGKNNDSIFSLKNATSPLGDNTLRRVKVEVEDIEPNDYISVTKKQKKLRKVHKTIEKRKLRLVQKHEEEIQELNKIWKWRREKLEEEHKVQLAVVSAIHSQSAMKIDKLKAVDIKFDVLIKDLQLSKERALKELEKKHSAEVDEENKNCKILLASVINDVNTHESESSNDRQFPTASGSTTGVLVSPHDTRVVGGENEPSEPVSAEQVEAANVSLQNPKDVTVDDVTSGGLIVVEDTEAVSGLLGGSLPQDGLSTKGTDMVDPLKLLNTESANASNNDGATGLHAASVSDCQIDMEQPDLHANITDSADGDGNMPVVSEQSDEAQPQIPVTPQVDEPLSEPPLGNTGDSVNTIDSQNHALSEAAGILPVGSEPNSLAPPPPDLPTAVNPVSVSRVAANAVESQNQPVIQTGPNSVELPNLPAAWPTRPRLLHDPLQYEMEKIWKDREQLIKLHEDSKSLLRTECEKEIMQLSAQIRNKYAGKMNEAEASYSAKRTAIDAIQSKIIMNKLLGEAFRFKCLDFRPSGSSVPLPGVPSALLQQQQPQSSSRHSPIRQLGSRHNQIGYRYTTGVVGLSSPLPSQPAIVKQHRPTNFSGNPSIRPPPLQISSFTPNIGTSRVSADIRAPPPHLQPFRPSSSSSTSIHLPLPPPHQPVRTSFIPPPPPPPPQSLPPLRSLNHSSSNVRVSESVTAQLSAMDLLRSVSSQSGGGQGNNSLSLPPVPVLNNKEGDVSDSKDVSSIRGTATSSLPSSDVVCLSDDDN